MDIATNIASLQGQISLQQTQAREQTAIQRLSTGLRINSAADDPSGLIAATSLKSDINTLDAQQSGDDRLYSKAALADNIRWCWCSSGEIAHPSRREHGHFGVRSN